jgi:hypothetical protein
MGENDAWQAALAFVSGHKLVAHDHAFENRPWLDYVDHRTDVPPIFRVFMEI